MIYHPSLFNHFAVIEAYENLLRKLDSYTSTTEMRHALRYEWGPARRKRGMPTRAFVILTGSNDKYALCLTRESQTAPDSATSTCKPQPLAASRLTEYKTDCAGIRNEKKVKEGRQLLSISAFERFGLEATKKIKKMRA
ncbi:hypothetical protein ACQP2F_32355 [Actinoplanes sp. CA-030573]|uniref:hypothetical protein n=1 Tax=Actinoplanes sp. CA-030573 TaxID=3239898 RepID=UPI003D905258